MFHLLGFIVDFVPLHAEDFRQHALDQVMAVHHAVGDFTALARERDFTGDRDANQPVAFQTAESLPGAVSKGRATRRSSLSKRTW